MNAVVQVLPSGRNALRARLSLLDAAAFGPLRQAPGRTLLAVLAIALGVALGFSVYLINRVAADEVQGASRSLFGLADFAVQSPGAGFDEALFPRLTACPRRGRRQSCRRTAGASARARADPEADRHRSVPRDADAARAGRRRRDDRAARAGVAGGEFDLAESRGRAVARTRSRRRSRRAGGARSCALPCGWHPAARGISTACRVARHRRGAVAIATAGAARSRRPSARAAGRS